MKEKGNKLIMKRVEEDEKGKKKIGEGKGREGIPYYYRANRTKRERERKREKEGKGKREAIRKIQQTVWYFLFSPINPSFLYTFAPTNFYLN